MKTVLFLAQKYRLLVACAFAQSRCFVVRGASCCTPFLGVIVLCVFISLIPGQAHADPPSQPAQLVAIDAFIDNVMFGAWDMAGTQAGYKASHGVYWQGLSTHPIPPVFGAPEPPILDSHPTDQAYTWEDIGMLFGPLQCSMRVDVYNGPDGHGYTLTTIVEISGDIWKRVINIGPETWRDSAWELYYLEEMQAMTLSQPSVSEGTFISPLEQ